MRKLKFIAWDKENNLLKRLGKVELVKGELIIKHHIILQFTGYLDKLGKEIYEDDILLSNGEEKVMIVWDNAFNGWALQRNNTTEPVDVTFISTITRLYNYHEKPSNN